MISGFVWALVSEHSCENDGLITQRNNASMNRDAWSRVASRDGCRVLHTRKVLVVRRAHSRGQHRDMFGLFATSRKVRQMTARYLASIGGIMFARKGAVRAKRFVRNADRGRVYGRRLGLTSRRHLTIANRRRTTKLRLVIVSGAWFGCGGARVRPDF